MSEYMKDHLIPFLTSEPGSLTSEPESGGAFNMTPACDTALNPFIGSECGERGKVVVRTGVCVYATQSSHHCPETARRSWAIGPYSS